MIKPLSRRQMLGVIGMGSLIFGGGVAEGFVREIVHLSVENVKIKIPNFEGSCRIAQISDLHYGSIGHTPCKSLATRINSLNADALAITGDTLTSFKGRDKLSYLIRKCRLPCYCVPGNWEHYIEWTKAEQKQFYNQIDVEFLPNQSTVANLGSGINIIGVDDPFTGFDDLETALKDCKAGIPKILLGHAPLIANQASFYKVDLTLCGHTHGGQVRLPFMGALLTPPGSDGFEMGLYEVDQMKLYVNRGIGTCIMPVRFLCPPEITLLTLYGEDTKT